jgi:hypothetical protein
MPRTTGIDGCLSRGDLLILQLILSKKGIMFCAGGFDIYKKLNISEWN